MGFPNYLDNTYYTVVLTGGDWVLPLSNLVNQRLSKYAKSDGVDNAATWFEADLGALRNILLGAIPSTNGTLSGTRRLRITDTPAFDELTTVGASGSIGDGTVDFTAPSNEVTVPEGCFFSIAGFLYKSDSTVVIAANATETVTLAVATGNDIHNDTLQSNITDGQAIVCNSGDYTVPVYDSDVTDIFQRIYAWGSLPWGHPSWGTGKATPEERQKLKFPIIDIMPDTLIGRYGKYEFFDDGNSADGFKVSRTFFTPGWQPSINPIYGAPFQYKTGTEVDYSFGGEESFAVKDGYRTQGFTIEHLPENEALTQALTMQRDQGIDKQMFFIFNPEDVENLHLRAYTARLETLDPLSYAYFNANTFSANLKEITGGLLV
jgi:hypothetical protein